MRPTAANSEAINLRQSRTAAGGQGQSGVVAEVDEPDEHRAAAQAMIGLSRSPSEDDEQDVDA